MKKVAILQSNYIPWKGYFDLINSVDEFILYDDMQYTRRDWRNRNKIKTSNGLIWLTIPVEVKGKYYQKIKDTKVADFKWNRKHWNAITLNYAKAACFKEFKEFFEELYLNCNEEFLSDINFKFITAISKILDIKTTITWSSNFNLAEGKAERIIGLVKDLKGDEYVSGPSAKHYINEELLSSHNIKLTWQNYEGYPVYSQLHGEFVHGVSILDLIFNEGLNSKYYMKSF